MNILTSSSCLGVSFCGYEPLTRSTSRGCRTETERTAETVLAPLWCEVSDLQQSVTNGGSVALPVHGQWGVVSRTKKTWNAFRGVFEFHNHEENLPFIPNGATRDTPQEEMERMLAERTQEARDDDLFINL